MTAKQKNMLARIVVAAVLTATLALLPDITVLPLGGIGKGIIYYLIVYAIIGWDAKIGKNAMVGETLEPCKPGEWKIAVVAPNYELPADAVVGANEMIG